MSNHQAGEQRHSTKISDQQVAEIHRRYHLYIEACEAYSPKAMALEFGVTYRTVMGYIYGERHKRKEPSDGQS